MTKKRRDYELRSQFTESIKQWNKTCTITAAVLIAKVHQKKREGVLPTERYSPPGTKAR